MNIRNKKSIYTNFFMNFIGTLIILGIGISRIEDNIAIKIIGDEYGYWAAGSWIAGYDWSYCTGITGYYGYGIGLIYAVILRLVTNQVVAYKIAIVLNACFIAGMFMISYRLVSVIDEQKQVSCVMKFAIALSANLYVANILYSQQSICENFLSLIVWWLIYENVIFIKKKSFLKALIVVALSAFSVAIHLRGIGIWGITVLFITLVLYKENVGINKILGLIGFAILCITVVLVVKELYQASMVINSASTNVNDFSGMTWRIHYFTTIEGIIDFTGGLFSKIFYAIISSFFLIIPPLVAVLKNIKNKYDSVFNSTCWYVVLLFIAEILIANFFISTGTRFDGLMYGRYFSNLMMPMIFLGMLALYLKYSYYLSTYRYFIPIFLVLANFVEKKQDYSMPKNAVYGAIPFLYKFLNEQNYAKNSIIAVALFNILFVTIAIAVLFLVKNKRKKEIVCLGTLLLISGIWIEMAFYAFDHGLSYGKIEPVQEIEMAEYIEKSGIEDKLVFCMQTFPSADVLQFLLKESTIYVVTDVEKLEDYEGFYVLTPAREVIEDFNENRYELLGQSSWLKLWKKVER